MEGQPIKATQTEALLWIGMERLNSYAADRYNLDLSVEEDTLVLTFSAGHVGIFQEFQHPPKQYWFIPSQEPLDDRMIDFILRRVVVDPQAGAAVENWFAKIKGDDVRAKAIETLKASAPQSQDLINLIADLL
jgi:hypothetical protein